MNNLYYDGTKLLSLMDINGEKPELYLCTSNRSAGKTTFFNRLCLKKWIEKREKFCLIYRYNYELDDCADKFFKDIGSLFFTGHTMTSKRRASGIYHELILDEENENCGYAVSLNSADQLKKYSHLLSDIQRMIFDEFQSESNHYCSDEIRKFLSVHTSIARGQGKQYRYLPVYMISNPVTIINPYYVEMGISERLNDNTKFMKGEGWVLEQGFNQVASNSQLNSGFNRAFKRNSYVAYSAQCVYLNDSKAFIDKPEGKSNYLLTLKYNGNMYGIREFPENGFVYADNRPDVTFPTRISVNTDDHEINYVMLRRNDTMIQVLRYYFERGVFRFKDIKCKEAVLKALSY